MEIFIKKFLKKFNVKDKYIKYLISPYCISFYTTVFTEKSYDDENNYLFLKTLGTVTVNQIIVWYVSRKYPELNPEKITQLKKNFIENDNFGEYCEKNNFSDLVLHNLKTINKEILEDVFEAFIGTTELLINKKFKFGLGYVVVNKICTYILDEIFIYKEELDPKTKLQELFKILNDSLVQEKFELPKNQENNFYIKLYKKNNNNGTIEEIGEGYGKRIIDAEQEASKQALIYLEKRNIYKSSKKEKEIQKIPHYSSRNKDFENFILSILKNIKFLEELKLDESDMYIYSKAFTDPKLSLENYDLLETLGDNTVNKCVLWYISNRFPQLNCPEAIDILTRLKISIIKSSSYSKLAEKLGFKSFISFNKINYNLESILEDVFEAFFAATEIVIDKKYKKGMGFIVCYKLIAFILNQENYSLKYEDLVDAKTRLKELIDSYKMTKIKYKTHRDINKYYSTIYELKEINRNEKIITEEIPFRIKGIGNDKKEAEQDVSQKFLNYYETLGFKKEIPKEYLKFCI